MCAETTAQLSRRESQIMEILFRLGSATAAQVLEELPDPPSYSAVRAALRVLTEKGHVRFERRSHHYVFSPTAPRAQVQRAETRRLLETFFDGSARQAVAALLDEAEELPDEELRELQELIRRAREEGR